MSCTVGCAPTRRAPASSAAPASSRPRRCGFRRAPRADARLPAAPGLPGDPRPRACAVPRHALEQARRTAAQGQKRVTAVLGRRHHRVASRQQARGAAQIGGLQRGAVAADQDHAAVHAQATREGRLHAHAQVGAMLRAQHHTRAAPQRTQPGMRCRPMCRAGGARGQMQLDRTAARGLCRGERTTQQAHVQARGARGAEPRRETRLYAARLRRLGEHHDQRLRAAHAWRC